MRLNYSEDEDFPGQFNLWQANCRRSLHSKRGQKALAELRDALLALPAKRLIAKALVEPEGDVCAIGAVALHRIPEAERVAWIGREGQLDHDLDEDDDAGTGYPRLVRWAIIAENDVSFGHLSPEDRYERMLAWCESHILGAP